MYSRILALILVFTMLYLVVSRFSSECQFKSFRKLVTVSGSRSQQFFRNLAARRVLLQNRSNAFECATGVFQTRTNKGEVGLTLTILWTGIKITSDETKGPVSLPYGVFYMKAPIQIGGQHDTQVRMIRCRVQRSSIYCILMTDQVSRPINLQDLTFVFRILHLSLGSYICHN